MINALFARIKHYRKSKKELKGSLWVGCTQDTIYCLLSVKKQYISIKHHGMTEDFLKN